MGNSNTCQVPSARPMILSAADSRYFRSLWQFLLSAERTGLSRTWAWRVYDLGLEADQIQRLRQRFVWCELITFEFSQYPGHVALAAKSYAWKPVIIADNLLGAEAPVFWFDSATILHTALKRPLSIIAENGIWTLRGKSSLSGICDPRVLDALQAPVAVWHLPYRAGGVMGFDPKHPAAVQLATEWKRHALIQEHIVPANAAGYHKQDQAVFSCLLLKAAAEGAITLTVDDVDISSASPAKDVTTRNVVNPEVPTWADPLARLYYFGYKKADQLSHRWNNFTDTRLDGARRWWKEHFTVYVMDVGRGITRAIPSPPYGYYADPFIWHHNGSNWLFVEEFQYARDQGRLVVMELAVSLDPVTPRPLASTLFCGDFDCHASFPHLFEMNGTVYMIPETSERRSVDLYACEHWPDRWRFERRLLFGIDAVDTMTLWSDGVWWLVTSVRSGRQNRHLEIFFTDDLLTGTLQAHPVNKARLYEDLRNGTGRNAGYLSKFSDGTIMRLMQKSGRYYGEGVAPMKVMDLTTEHFAEQPAESIPELPIVTPGFSTHHVSRAGNLIAYDVRDKVR